jgi:hypothetical protein
MTEVETKIINMLLNLVRATTRVRQKLHKFLKRNTLTKMSQCLNLKIRTAECLIRQLMQWASTSFNLLDDHLHLNYLQVTLTLAGEISLHLGVRVTYSRRISTTGNLKYKKNLTRKIIIPLSNTMSLIVLEILKSKKDLLRNISSINNLMLKSLTETSISQYLSKHWMEGETIIYPCRTRAL